MGLGKLIKWHYRLGIFSALFVVLMAITGIMINHTNRLELGHNYIQSEWLLNWYNISPRSEVVSYKYKDVYITQIDKRLFLSSATQKGKEITPVQSKLRGVAVNDKLIVVVTHSEVLLMTRKGQLVEKLSNQSSRWGEIAGIGLSSTASNRKIWIKTPTGYFYTDSQLSQWSRGKETIANQVNWSTRGELPTAAGARLMELYRGKGLTMERVVLDLHTGRILGGWGVYLMDAAAIIFILLAVTGITIWFRRRKKLSQKQESTAGWSQTECPESAR